ncbi:MAG: choice-of-anchor tandem repeat GloVer-containing protein, partial [Stellaceae bacterium]
IKKLRNDAMFGTTTYGGSGAEINNGNVFEVAKTKDGYASTPTVLFTFDVLDGVHPEAGLIIDADGNLFGTASAGGASFQGTVFELPKTAQGYASTPTVLVSFNGANGANPEGGLIFDAAGKLFGTTTAGGAYGFGTVFEIAKTKTGYTTTPTTLVSFDGSNGASPDAALMFNRKGDLLGTTAAGGPYGVGTVFEIAKMKGSYASRPSTLVSFNVANGDNPFGGLIADARGDLFGSTVVGGANQDGTIFELAKTRGGYAPALTTLVSFNGTDGFQPVGLLADAKGDLLGPTYFGGASNDGTVFELTGSGFVPRLAFAGTPGSAECYGQSVLSLLQHDRNLDVAAATRGLGRAEALQTAISEYCGTLAP